MEYILTNTSVSIDDDLLKKLELYQIYSKTILEMKNEKSKLDKLFAKQESTDEMILKTKSELIKQIIEKNKEFKIIKDSMAQLIMTKSNPWSYLAKLDSEIADEIASIIAKKKEQSKKLKSTLIKKIAVLYDLDQENIILEVKNVGIQDGFIVKDKSTGLKLFTKTSKTFGYDTNSIDPRELFVYKVLEHIELGPETRFIITASSSNPSGAKICHIVTKDVGYSNYEDITNIFFTDNFINEENPHSDTLVHWQKS